ncbi:MULTISPECIES: CitMHS family transporter [unclassified Acinetobacter]|uniref:CitMHS family transporter n=1 Tax=unclassified Acinetobacter TaxID=196816 RepID=UPI0035BB66D7
MLALFGMLIVIGFMALIMTRKASPFTSLVLVPLIVGLVAGAMHLGHFAISDIPKFAIAGMISDADLKIKGVAGTALMLLFAILYFGLMLSAGLFQPLVNLIVRVVKGDPLKVLVGTAILALGVSVDGDGSTTTLVVCAAMLPIYRKLNMKMMDLAVLIILANSIMNLLPWGGPTARIITALKVDEGELLRAIIPGMILASLWVIGVAVIRGLSERKRLGITNLDTTGMAQIIDTPHDDDAKFARPHLVWVNFALTVLVMLELIFGGMWIFPKMNSALIFAIALAIAFVINYPKQADQREIIEKYGSSAVQVIFMVLAAGVFMGVLSGTGMSNAMGEALATWIPESFGSHWPLIVALVSVPGTFLLSNDAFYLGVLPVLNQVGAKYGFSSMDIAIASTAGQAFHLLSPLVGFIYLLLQLTGIEMGKWQVQSAKWAIGIFVLFLVAMFTMGGVRL